MWAWMSTWCRGAAWHVSHAVFQTIQAGVLEARNRANDETVSSSSASSSRFPSGVGAWHFVTLLRDYPNWWAFPADKWSHSINTFHENKSRTSAAPKTHLPSTGTQNSQCAIYSVTFIQIENFCGEYIHNWVLAPLRRSENVQGNSLTFG